MKNSQLLKEDVLLKEGISILMKKLGPIETSRFLTIPMSKRMESVKRHRAWQKDLEKETFFDEVFGK
ncbi:MAG: hypothetical protein ACYTFY_06460 [Planctomycetota bacterium]|jgi:hypothetical protein